MSYHIEIRGPNGSGKTRVLFDLIRDRLVDPDRYGLLITNHSVDGLIPFNLTVIRPDRIDRGVIKRSFYDYVFIDVSWSRPNSWTTIRRRAEMFLILDGVLPAEARIFEAIND